MGGIDHLHLTGITLGISPVVRAAALSSVGGRRSLRRSSVSFDPNLRLNLWPDREEMLTVVNTVAAACQRSDARTRRGPAADRT